MVEEAITQVPGNVWKVLVSQGDEAKPGDVLFILEVMKTEVPHLASQAGTATAVNIAEGQEGVDAGMVAVGGYRVLVAQSAEFGDAAPRIRQAHGAPVSLLHQSRRALHLEAPWQGTPCAIGAPRLCRLVM